MSEISLLSNHPVNGNNRVSTATSGKANYVSATKQVQILIEIGSVKLGDLTVNKGEAADQFTAQERTALASAFEAVQGTAGEPALIALLTALASKEDSRPASTTIEITAADVATLKGKTNGALTAAVAAQRIIARAWLTAFAASTKPTATNFITIINGLIPSGSTSVEITMADGKTKYTISSASSASSALSAPSAPSAYLIVAEGDAPKYVIFADGTVAAVSDGKTQEGSDSFTVTLNGTSWEVKKVEAAVPLAAAAPSAVTLGTIKAGTATLDDYDKLTPDQKTALAKQLTPTQRILSFTEGSATYLVLVEDPDNDGKFTFASTKPDGKQWAHVVKNGNSWEVMVPGRLWGHNKIADATEQLAPQADSALARPPIHPSTTDAWSRYSLGIKRFDPAVRTALQEAITSGSGLDDTEIADLKAKLINAGMSAEDAEKLLTALKDGKINKKEAQDLGLTNNALFILIANGMNAANTSDTEIDLAELLEFVTVVEAYADPLGMTFAKAAEAYSKASSFRNVKVSELWDTRTKVVDWFSGITWAEADKAKLSTSVYDALSGKIIESVRRMIKDKVADGTLKSADNVAAFLLQLAMASMTGLYDTFGFTEGEITQLAVTPFRPKEVDMEGLLEWLKAGKVEEEGETVSSDDERESVQKFYKLISEEKFDNALKVAKKMKAGKGQALGELLQKLLDKAEYQRAYAVVMEAKDPELAKRFIIAAVTADFQGSSEYIEKLAMDANDPANTWLKSVRTAIGEHLLDLGRKKARDNDFVLAVERYLLAARFGEDVSANLTKAAKEEKGKGNDFAKSVDSRKSDTTVGYTTEMGTAYDQRKIKAAQGAVEYLEKLIAQNPQHPKKDDINKAIEAFRKITADSPVVAIARTVATGLYDSGGKPIGTPPIWTIRSGKNIQYFDAETGGKKLTVKTEDAADNKIRRYVEVEVGGTKTKYYLTVEPVDKPPPEGLTQAEAAHIDSLVANLFANDDDANSWLVNDTNNGPISLSADAAGLAKKAAALAYIRQQGKIKPPKK